MSDERPMPRTVHDLAADPAYDFVAAFRLRGGRAIYDSAQYLERGQYQSVLVSTFREGRIVKRWLDPDTEIEVVSVMQAEYGGHFYSAVVDLEEPS